MLSKYSWFSFYTFIDKYEFYAYFYLINSQFKRVIMKKVLILMFCLPFSIFAQNTLDGDCPTSTITVFEFSTLSLKGVKGGGADPKEANGANCFGGTVGNVESISIWLKWTCAKAGTITFTITPDVTTDDIDFILYETTSINTCENRKTIRCMAAGTTPGVCALLGPTGLRKGSIDLEENSGCDGDKDNFLKPLNMTVGQSYALMINNFDSSVNGFKITFEGDGDFYPALLKNNEVADNEQFKIFPSPSSIAAFNFTHEIEGNNQLEVMNLCGQVIYKQENILQNTLIELPNNTPKGAYFVRFTKENYSKTFKWNLIN